MHVTVFAVCDSAMVDQAGKLSMMGIFHGINARQFPAAHPSMAIGIELVAGAPDWGREHVLTVQFVSEEQYAPLAEWVVNCTPQPVGQSDLVYVPFVITLQHVPFRTPGAYAFIATLDGEPVGRVDIDARLIDPS